MEEHMPYYFGQGDVRWQDNKSPPENTVSQPDEAASSTLEANTYQTTNWPLPPEPLSNYPDVPFPDTSPMFYPSHELLSLYMGASESCLYGNFCDLVWEQPPLDSLLVENVFPEAYLSFQQSPLSNEHEAYPSIPPDLGYLHISPQFQQVLSPYSSLIESGQSTMNMHSTFGDTPSSGVDNATPLTSITTHTAQAEDTYVAQTESDERPYAYLLHRALLSANNHRLTLQEIYGWFEENTSKANRSSTTSWKSSIRYNLSMNKGFFSYTELSPSKSKTRYWTLTEEALQNGILPTTRTRLYRSRQSPRPENLSPRRQDEGRKA